ncbi:MAG: type I-E CRISPR-associated endoribonuclease Cas2e [Anaerovoracaceae bacterium]|jgi:CRISPR-associated protein Cas2
MIVLNISNCPSGLRGDLSKWLSEVSTGVYVGKLSARVREELWKRICDNLNNGQATMVFSSNNEQGYKYLVHNTTWKPIDFEGITLMRRPLPKKRGVSDQNRLSIGFSNASKHEKIRRATKKKSYEEYIVLDLETTGLDYKRDKIIEIGALKISNSEIIDRYKCLVNQQRSISEKVSKLTGITNDILTQNGVSEGLAVRQLLDFIGRSLVFGYNVQFDLSFIRQACIDNSLNYSVRKSKDVLQLARRKIDGISDYKLSTLAAYYSLETTTFHRALPDCELTFRIYKKLNESE